jgi:hypothetical protein
MLPTSNAYKIGVYDQIRMFQARVTIEMEAFAKDYFQGIRYIRDWINGSTANTTNYWNAIKAFSGETDLARGIIPTTNGTMTNAANITDGSDTTYGYAWAGLIYAQIDLGVIRTDIDKIQVIHYYLDGRTFHNGKTEVSADGITWVTLRDSAVSGEYAETSAGQTFTPNKETIKVYGDETIIRMNILEEMSTLNESVPSNELQLTLKNDNGDFDLLNFNNMHQILASKPTIQTELGLFIFEETESQFWTEDLVGKVYGSDVINPHAYRYRYASTLPNPQDITANATQTHLDRLAAQDNSTSALSTTTNGYIPYGLWRFDIIEALTRKFGEAIWGGAVSRADRAILAEKYISRLNAVWYGYGTAPTGNTATLRLGSGSSYFGTTRSHTNAAVTALNIATYSITSAVTWDGYVNVVAYGGASDGVTASLLRTDFVKLEITTNPIEPVYEWLPCGKFFLTEWKNEITNKIVSLTGNDYFALFADTSYEPVGITNLKDLAVSVLTVGGVPAENQDIDDSLANITVRSFPERIDCRTALQHIAIAAGAAVGQDRLGNVFIKPFKILDEATSYITYPSTQPSLYSHVGSGTYPITDTGGGMRYLDFDQMYSEPIVNLEKSVYQLVVKVYSDEPETEPVEYVYTNASIEGMGGSSFTIDNPLINTVALANMVSEWYIREINYNAIYQVNWRQNPALECADVILVEDSFSAEKQTRIIRQEFQYEGYLQGVTESRGGI